MASESNPLAGFHVACYNMARWQFFVDGQLVNWIPKDMLFKVTSSSLLISTFIIDDNLEQFFKGHEFKAVYGRMVVTASIDSVAILPSLEVKKIEVPWVTLRIGSRPHIDYVKGM
ncbi:hypothetical protein [Levilactobacillus andaensis]|uniref:hypothetical protein n=1 Tax=Levilactobacillus andaensis TaxID=2799570 RepID=UPI001945A2F1|nr:hypothetical protein [Levilactobacillus andaensis]